MSVDVHPCQAGLGADISGVDSREPLSTADRDAIRKAWLDNLVLRFRGAPMTDEQHMAFTGQFGELEYNPAKLIEKQYGWGGHPDRGAQERDPAGNLGDLEHHRGRQGDRRA